MRITDNLEYAGNTNSKVYWLNLSSFLVHENNFSRKLQHYMLLDMKLDTFSYQLFLQLLTTRSYLKLDLLDRITPILLIFWRLHLSKGLWTWKKNCHSFHTFMEIQSIMAKVVTLGVLLGIYKYGTYCKLCRVFRIQNIDKCLVFSHVTPPPQLNL